MAISESVIIKTAELAHLSLTPDEVKLFTSQLSAVVENVSKLSQVNTDGVEPMVTPTPMDITLREDVVTNPSGGEQAVSNAPERSGNLYKVPPVL